MGLLLDDSSVTVGYVAGFTVCVTVALDAA
jgi:hypothetical protein